MKKCTLEEVYLRLLACVLVTQYHLVIALYGDEETVPRVVDGLPASLGEVPYQVSFKRFPSHSTEYYLNFCGGSIISPYKIVTAAHCFVKRKEHDGAMVFKDFTDYYAVAGTLWTISRSANTNSDSISNGQWRRIRKVYVPKDYDFPKSDIAVVHIKNQFNYNYFIRPITFARKFMDYSEKTCQASGFGKTILHLNSNERIKASPILLTATIKLSDPLACNALHKKDMQEFICTRNCVGCSSVAQGDSGGPLVCKGTNEPQETPMGILVGVTSAYSDKTGPIYTRTSAFAEELDRDELERDEFETSFATKVVFKSFWLLLLLNLLELDLG